MDRCFCAARIHTKSYTPGTNGNAARFINTALAEWACVRAYATSDQRAEHLRRWLHDDNWHRPHRGINSAKPIQCLRLSGDNVLRLRR